MNYIEQMVAELCPRGVEFRELGEICQIQTGKLNANKAVPNGAYPFFTCSKDVSRIDSYRWDTEALLLAGNGYLGDVKHYCGKFDAYQRTYVLTGFSSEISPRFLYFILSNGFTEWAEKHQKEGSVPYIVLSVVQSFRIPLPPLPIQQEIVRVLDKFSQLVKELQANLHAELVARRKQYQYYRDQLLSFEGREDVRWGTLGEVAAYSDTRIPAASVDANTFVGVDNLLPNQAGRTASTHVPTTGNLTEYQQGDILIGNIRPYLKKIWLATNRGGCSGDVLAVRISDAYRSRVQPGFLYQLLSSEAFFDFDMKHAKGGKMPRGSKAMVLQYRIPIPPLAEQEEIAGILDKFDALVNDLSIGLPAEIAARQKQYEYYRDRLLTFPEAG